MAKYVFKWLASYDAQGGPEVSAEGGDGHIKTPTASGRFTIQTVEKHISYGKYSLWSGVVWGTRVRKTGNVTELMRQSRWIKLTSVNTSWGKYTNDQAAATRLVQDYFTRLYGRTDFPTSWVFNDFGHISVKYFRDINYDGVLNGKERILGDFIHTTPGNEADTLLAKPITLSESHGCVHVKPVDIDAMIRAGYLRPGNIIEVHPYTAKTIPAQVTRSHKRRDFEVHFFPYGNALAVYKLL